ncbi:MAG: glycosyltransferase family 87 protein [Saprospiraceae bacterium]
MKTVQIIGLCYAALALAAAIQSYTLAPSPESLYSHYNNYEIFRYAFFNLLAGNNLYLHYPHAFQDLYKYSPTFAMCFGPLAVLPDWAGLCLWNILNALSFYFAVRMLPGLAPHARNAILLLCLPELFTSLQNEQSNGLMAAMMIAAIALLEQRRPALSALTLVGSVFVKLFSVVLGALFIFYEKKIRYIGWGALWTLLLLALPAPLVGWSELLWQYRNWGELLAMDHAGSMGLSVQGWLASWFDLYPDKTRVTLIGGALGLLPLLRRSAYHSRTYRYFSLSAWLIWSVIFNHKAESPTFIIAMAGVAIWYHAQPRTHTNTALLTLAFVFTSLSVTDLFPAWVKQNWFEPYVVKAVPCILIWAKITADQCFSDLFQQVDADRSQV